MRIEIHTFLITPKDLWGKIKEFIEDGKIETWEVITGSSTKTKYLTHVTKSKQWYKKALLKDSTLSTPSRLVITVRWFKDQEPDEYTKALYIGRFTQELLAHFSSDFTRLGTFP